MRSPLAYLSIALAACTAGALPRVGLGDGDDEKRLQSRGGLRDANLHHARVHHVLDPADGHRRLCDVGRQDHLARVRRRGREHHQLLVRRQGSVQRVDLLVRQSRRADEQWVGVLREELELLLQQQRQRLDLLLAREEHQNVARGHVQMQLEHRDQRRLDIVRLGRGRVATRQSLGPRALDLDREGAALDLDEVAGVLLARAVGVVVPLEEV